LAVGSDCPVCDEPTEVVSVDDEPPAELNIVSSQLRGERAHPGHAREKAREVLREHRIGQPLVVVHSIARKCGFEVRNTHQLGKGGGPRFDPGRRLGFQVRSAHDPGQGVRVRSLRIDVFSGSYLEMP
jgi:hypothetical protein